MSHVTRQIAAAHPPSTARPGAPWGAVHTTAGTVRPVAGARLTGGLLYDWQRRNADATIPHTIERLRDAGNVTNLRRLLDGGDTPYQGRYPFLDTDLYKTLEGVAYALGDGAGGAAREFFDEVVELLGRVQAPDGYLNSYFQDPDCPKRPWQDLAWGHELYTFGHLVQAAVAARRRLGDDRLLAVAVRFADLVVARFGESGQAGICGHPEVELALVELYRETGNRAYLRQAQLFVDRRGHGLVEHRVFAPEYFQDHVPLREMESVTGHAVRMGYLAAGATDVAVETGDAELLAALGRLWDDMVDTKLYLTGGLGSRHADEAVGDRYELPAERAYSETCAAIAVMQWAWRMFLATGRADVLDGYERVLYNAFAVGVSLSGTEFFYDNPMQRRPDHSQRSGAEIGGEPLRRGWYACPCCPPNVVRWMAQLGDYLAAEDDRCLYLAGYASARIPTGTLTLRVDTDYPWDGEVRVVVEDAAPGRRAIALRVPGWADGAEAAVDGAPVDATPRDGWLVLDREWAAGAEIRLRLAMPVRAHGSHPYLDATRGAAAIARGPLVYCVEQQDSPAPVDDLVVDAARVAAARPYRPDDGLPGTAIRLDAGVAAPTSRALYPPLGSPPAVTGTVPVGLVPYFLWGNRRPEAMRVWLRTA